MPKFLLNRMLMKPTVCLIAMCCFSLLCGKAFSQEWISIDGTPKGETVTMKVLQSDAYGYQLKVKIHGVYDYLHKNNKGYFHRLSLGEGGCLLNQGEPALPTLSKIIVIPPGTKVSASIENVSGVVYGK